jgi:hypothetical protein
MVLSLSEAINEGAFLRSLRPKYDSYGSSDYYGGKGKGNDYYGGKGKGNDYYGGKSSKSTKSDRY